MPPALQLDTEGFDALALQGSTNSLMAGKAGMVLFEYHDAGLWLRFRLRVRRSRVMCAAQASRCCVHATVRKRLAAPVCAQDVVQRMAGLNYVCYFDGAWSALLLGVLPIERA